MCLANWLMSVAPKYGGCDGNGSGSSCLRAIITDLEPFILYVIVLSSAGGAAVGRPLTLIKL